MLNQLSRIYNAGLRLRLRLPWSLVDCGKGGCGNAALAIVIRSVLWHPR